MQVYLATDADSAGGNLAAELSRRLKRYRCKVTAWPTAWEDHRVYMDNDTANQHISDFAAVCSSPQCLHTHHGGRRQRGLDHSQQSAVAVTQQYMTHSW